MKKSKNLHKTNKLKKENKVLEKNKATNLKKKQKKPLNKKTDNNQTNDSLRKIQKPNTQKNIKPRSRKKDKVSKTKSKRRNDKTNVTKIKVVGVGGCGGHIVSRLFGDFPRNVDTIVINTDLQDLEHCTANKKLYIGRQTTRGLGAGMDPEVGMKSAEENREEITQALKGADVVFITAGFGGGTGTGGTPVVSEIAKELGILTISIVTKPFYFEGVTRKQIAENGVERMKGRADTLVVIPNDKIFSIVDSDTSVIKAFSAIDKILKNAVLGVAEVIINPGLINVDFADIKYVMQHSGSAIIGIGFGSGKNRAVTAVNDALNSPLLETSIEGADGLLLTISGRKDMKMNEINEIAKIVSENLNPSARIIFGTYYDRKINKGAIKVTLIATGFDSPSRAGSRSLFGGFDDAEDVDTNNTPKIDFDNDEESDDIKQVEELDIKEDEESDKDIDDSESLWDIPAFLRKKNKNKHKK